MKEENLKKIKKGLWVYPWIAEVLDKNAIPHNGNTSLVASAAILMFDAASNQDKAAFVMKVNDKEVFDIYGVIDESVKKSLRQAASEVSQKNQGKGSRSA